MKSLEKNQDILIKHPTRIRGLKYKFSNPRTNYNYFENQ
jgi:hypothetical protein